MQSKTSFFNKTLYSKAVMRNWPLWGLLSFFGALLPVISLVERMNERNLHFTPGDCQMMYYTIVSSAVPVISFIYAIIVAMLVWDYLYSQRSVVFYHSMPVRRECLFVTNFLAGLTIMLIPYVVAAILMTIEMVALGGFSLSATLMTVWAVFAMSFLFFSIATIIAHLTGFSMALPVLYLVFNFLVPGIEALVRVLRGELLYGLNSSFRGIKTVLSPIIYLYQTLEVKYTSGKEFLNEYGFYSYRYEDAELVNADILTKYAVAALAITVIAFFIYKNRKSESAGRVITLKPVKYFIHALFSAIAAVAGGMLLALFIDKTNDVAGITVCTLIMGVVAFFAGKMLVERTARVFNKRTLLGCIGMMAFCLVFCLSVGLDWFGAEQYVPDIDKIESIHITGDGNGFDLTPEQNPEIVMKVLELHKALVEEKETVLSRRARYFDESHSYNDGWAYIYTCITYNLKNGKTIEREYSYALEKDFETSYINAYNAFVSNPALLEMTLHTNDEFDAFEVTYSIDSNEKYYSDTVYGEEVKTFYDAVVRDAKAGNWNPYGNRFAAVYEEEGEPYMYINLCFEFSTQEAFYNPESSTIYDSVYVNVTSEMAETRKVLCDLGLLREDK